MFESCPRTIYLICAFPRTTLCKQIPGRQSSVAGHFRCTGLPCSMWSQGYLSQADTWKAVFSLGNPPHPRPLCWPSLLIKSCHINPHHVVSRLSTLISCHINNPHMWSQGFLISSSRLLQGSLQSWIFSPTSTDCAGLSCFKEAATSTSLICGLKALMLLKQTLRRQCSVLELLPNLD